MKYHIVKYTGAFGFIKPWTAVRDGETFSQQFLTPSILEGMEKKLFPELLGETGIHKIKGHRLSYDSMDSQQEKIQPRGWNMKSKSAERKQAILTRYVLLNPVLHLAFENEADAQRAVTQHLCLCRNEDILYPKEIFTATQEEFEESDLIPGFELVFEKTEAAFLVGYNRFQEASPMYGWLRTVGNPVNEF